MRAGSTTLQNRPNTALLVVDVQRGVVEGMRATPSSRTSPASSRKRGRRGCPSSGSSTPMSLVRGSDDWRIVPELTPGDGEPLVEKI